MRLLELLVPGHAEHRVLARELAKRPHECGDVRPGLGNHLVGQDGREHRALAGGLGAERAPGHHVREARDGADPPRGHLGDGLKARALIEAHLVDLLLPRGSAIAARELHLGAQRAARHLHPGEPLAAGRAGDAVDAGRKLRGPVLLGNEMGDAVEQLVHAVVAQRGAEEAREDPAGGHDARKRRRSELAALQILVQSSLVACCCLLRCRRVAGEQRGRVDAARREARGELGEKFFSPGVFQVALVHEDKGRNRMALEQVPKRLGMALDAVVGPHHENRVVEGLQRALRLGGEVHVAGRVHEHEVGVAPVKGGAGRENRDAALALHGVGVEVRVAAVHAAGVANGARDGEHGLRERGLARVDVRQKSHDRLSHASTSNDEKGLSLFIIGYTSDAVTPSKGPGALRIR